MKKDNSNGQMIDIKELAFVLLHNIWLIILLAVIGYVGMYMYAKHTEQPTYTTSVSLYVKNTTNKAAVDSVSITDISAAKTIAETYIAILEDDIVMESISDKLLEKYSVKDLSPYFAIVTEDDGTINIAPQSIRNTITFTQVNNTELLNVSVTTASPVMSAEICKAVTESSPELLRRVVGAGAVEAVGEAKVPKYSNGSTVPSSARTGMYIGIALAIAIIYLRYILDNTVNNGEVIKAKYDLPMLAEIPFYDVTGTGKKSNKVNALTKLKNRLKKNDDKIERSIRTTIKDVEVPFVVTEAYNTLRTNMLFALSTHNSNIAVISSSFSGEGKSTSAANLAISIGDTDSKILIVDADLRKPTQHKLFKLKNEKGLSSILGGMCKFEDAVNRSVSGNLDVLTAGPIPPNPSQMFMSEKMDEFLKKVSSLYDYVIIDTSPINIVSDALTLSKSAAGVVLVARQGITTFDQIEKAIGSIQFADSDILGVVINYVNYDNGMYSKKGYYKYKYRYNYNYTYTDKTADNKNDSKK